MKTHASMLPVTFPTRKSGGVLPPFPIHPGAACRRRLLPVLILLVLLFAAASCLPGARAAGRPDVLFIAVDDLNDWISCLGGNPQLKTPNIDRLAARGTLFTNAHCAAPACNPSRAALMSGRRPWSTGIYLNAQPHHAILSEITLLNSWFKQNGYRTLGGGKIFHTGDETTGKWDDYFKRVGFPSPPVESVSGLNKGHFDWGPLDAGDAEMGDTKLVDWAIEQLAAERDQPLFLAVGFVKPHLPWYAPAKYFHQFPAEIIEVPEVPADDLDDIPPAGVKMANPGGDHADVLEHRQWKHAVQGYLATITYLDGQVGRLLDAFDAGPKAAETIVVFWGDHGWHLGEKQHWRKFALWEEATRVPYMIVAPGVGKPGATCDRPVDLMSIYPTLCELAGLETPPHVEGHSLVPLLRDPAAEWEHHAVTTHGRGNHAVRSLRYRYIRYKDGSEELYDHDADPREYANLASQPGFEEIVTELAASLPAKEAPDAPTQSGEKKRKKKQ